MRCTSATGRWVNELMPLRSSAAITASVEPTCARVGGGVQRAVEAVIGIDAVLFAELANGVDAAFRFLDQAHRLFNTEQTFKGEVLGRPRQRAPAIAATGAGAADVGLDQQHSRVRGSVA